MSPPTTPSQASRREKFLEAVQQASIFGGSITFVLIVGSNSTPTRHFTDQTVRDLLSAAWLLFSIALGGATLARVRATAGGKEQSVFELREGYRFYVIGFFALAAFGVLSVVVLAYSDVGWAAVAVMGLGILYVTGKGVRRRWRRTRKREREEVSQA